MSEKKEKQYVSDNAQLMAEWNWDKNISIDPTKLTLGSNKKVWWKCPMGHEWQTKICHKNIGSGCPYCSNKKVLKGFNDLQTLNSTLATDWNYEKNGKSKPENFTANSEKKVWWKCQKGHEWQATIVNRNKGNGCPYCSNKKISTGYNDLATCNPSLAKEWNFEKNNGSKPEEFSANSNKKVWWKCQKGHEWQATIVNRNNGNGCPYCSGRNAIKGKSDLLTVNPNLAKEWNFEKNNGSKPEDFTANSTKKVWWRCQKDHEWQAAINHRNKGIGCPYCSGRYAIKGKNDLLTVNPNLAKEWNYDKNNGLKPEDFTANSTKKVWWICKKGHEWQAIIESRNTGIGCPYCSGRYAIKGVNDLLTVNPTLASEWNYEKNSGLTPMDVLPNSGKKVWWICKKGHEWQATIESRNDGRGCPACNSERNTSLPEYAIVYYLKKYGLEVLHSYKEFGYELDIYIPSKKTAIEYDGFYWHNNKAKKDLKKNQKCKKDGIKLYRIREGLPSLNDSSIDYIVQKNQKDLPQVLEKVLSEIIGANINVNLEKDAIEIENLREYTEKENSLLLSNPTLASEWNYEKNGNLKPETFTAHSGKKVWWKCKKGHEWQSSIARRNRGTGCPYCSNQKVLQGYNDLASINPNLAQEWNYEKNGDLKPERFTIGSNKKVWWICQKGHEWQAIIADRNNGNGCPYCSNKKIVQGYNDLATRNPNLAQEWNYEKNGELKPEQFSVNSGKKVWWKCPKGHEWETSINHRSRGKGCPYCSGRYVIKGENDLQTVNPFLACEWNYEKNNGLTPADVLPSSNKKVWWRCKKNHEWQATIAHRTNGTGCPYCSGRKK